MAIGDRLAVLRRGIVEQIGTSNELYTNPDSAFVSNFIGKMNFFNATLTAKNQARIVLSETLVDVKPEKVRIAAEAKLSLGDAVLIGARPEQMEISKEMSKGAIEGHVQIIQHLGQVVRYEVLLDERMSDAPMEIDMPALIGGISERDKVYVSLKEGMPFMFLPEERN